MVEVAGCGGVRRSGVEYGGVRRSEEGEEE